MGARHVRHRHRHQSARGGFPTGCPHGGRLAEVAARTPRSGIFISDENKEIVRDVEKSIKVLRGIEGTLKLGQIIEKGFFIDSSKSGSSSFATCGPDLAEERGGQGRLPDNPLHHSGIALLDPLICRDDEPGKTCWSGSPPKKRSGQGHCPESVGTGSFWSLY